MLCKKQTKTKLSFNLNEKENKMHFVTDAKICFVLTIIVCVSLACVSTAKADICDEVPTGLVGWWSGDGTADDSCGGNHGTLMNGATFAAGKVGLAFSLDGENDYVAIPYSPSFNLESLTLQAWVKYTRDDRAERIISRPEGGNSEDGYSYFLLENGYGKLGGGVHGEGTDYTVSVSTGIYTFNDDEWHLATFVHDVVKDEITIYVDGYFSRTYPDSSPGGMEHNLNGINIGSYDGTKWFFQGLIDEVAIWNRALTATEIQDMFDEYNVEPEPDIDVSPSTYDFGDVELGTNSSLLLTIFNMGNSNLTVDSMYFTTGSSTDFTIPSLPTFPLTVAPGVIGVDIEVVFAPLSVGWLNAVLEIVSDDADEPVVQVYFEGVGEALPSQQIEDIIQFIRESQANGTLVGLGSQPDKKIDVLVNMLEAVGDLITAGDIEKACQQLSIIMRKCDGQSPPPDFVAGTARPILVTMIQDLMEDLGCE
jgi:hypothetical protein